MTAPIYITPSPVAFPDPPASNAEIASLLRQLLDVQKEQVALLKAQQAAQDQGAKWRAFLARWADEFPDAGAHCKDVIPALERAYLALGREMTDRLRSDDPDDLGSEFVLGEFLDRYGIRLAQLGNILSQISPLADAAPPRSEGET